MHEIIEEYRSTIKGPVFVRPEINLAKWPQLFATRQTPGLSRVIERVDSKVVIGKQINNKGNEIEVGFLIVPDYVVLMGLIHIWELNDRPQEENVDVYVRSFVRQVLCREVSQPVYHHLELSMKRLKHVPIRWINAFYDSRTGKLETIDAEEFNILQYLKTKKVAYGAGQPGLKAISFKFNDHFLKNLLNNETKPLLLNELVQFGKELSVLTYAFLDLVMAARTRWERRVTAFMRDDLQITAARYRKPANCRDELSEVIKELDGHQLSTGTLHLRLRKTSDGRDYKLIVDKEPVRQEQAVAGRELALIPETETESLIHDMVAVLGRERNRRFYQLIAQRCPQELIHTALQDTIMEARSGKIQTSKAAFFGYWIQELCRNHGINLGLKSKKPHRS